MDFMATWKPQRISDVINEIDDEKFVLPVIQRRLVWDEEKMELLFDTVLKGDSFGGIMVIEEEKDTKPLFNFRPFTRDGEPIPSRQVDTLKQLQYFVIDGQQRLQSFYIGLKGSIDGKVLYFDLFSDSNTEFQFKFANDVKHLPLSSKENSDRPIPEHLWFLVSSLLKRLKSTRDEDPVAREITKAYNIVDITHQDCIRSNVKAFLMHILNFETVGISTVSIYEHLGNDVNRQRIVELFRRLNDGGTKLSPFDLVASILKGFAWEMEAFLDATLKEYDDIGLNQDNLIKLIFILRDDHKKEMASIDQADATFAVSNRERIASTLKALRAFLAYARLIDYYKEGKPSFIPLYFIAYHIFHKDISDRQIISFFNNYDSGNSDFGPMQEWLFHSLINGVFRSKGAGWIPYKTGIKKLLEVMSQKHNQAFPTTDLFNVYFDHPLPAFTTRYSQANLDILDSSFIFYLMYDKKQFIRVQDIDHIMPKSKLDAFGFDSSQINSIKNFQLIDYETNRGAKSDTSFKDWINDPACVKDKAAFMKKHLIPSDESLWDLDKFVAFAEQRAELILQKLADSLPRLLVPSVDEQALEDRQGASTGSTSNRPTRDWDKETFFHEIRTRRSEEEVGVAEKLFEWTETHHALTVSWGKGTQRGSFSPILKRGEVRYHLFSCTTTGFVKVVFDLLRWTPALKDSAKRMELRERLNGVAGISINESDITGNPSISLATLAPGAALADFLAVIDWLVAEISIYSEQ